MTNPFDDENASYLVLCNGEEQHSLWPASLTMPEGWAQRYGPGRRADCLAYVEAHWIDMRPRSLIISTGIGDS
jgi:MbtH protein